MDRKLCINGNPGFKDVSFDQTLDSLKAAGFDGIFTGWHVGKMKEVAFCSIVAYSCVNLGLVALLVLVFHWGIWGVWTGTLCSQASQALMLRYFISKTPVFRRDASLPESDPES